MTARETKTFDQAVMAMGPCPHATPTMQLHGICITCWRDTAAAATAHAARMQVALHNVLSLARRMRRGGPSADDYEHLMRFCAEAGVDAP